VWCTCVCVCVCAQAGQQQRQRKIAARTQPCSTRGLCATVKPSNTVSVLPLAGHGCAHKPSACSHSTRSRVGALPSPARAPSCRSTPRMDNCVRGKSERPCCPQPFSDVVRVTHGGTHSACRAAGLPLPRTDRCKGTHGPPRQLFAGPLRMHLPISSHQRLQANATNYLGCRSPAPRAPVARPE
jgi:hypothetical protein